MKRVAALCFLFICFYLTGISSEPLRKPAIELFVDGVEMVDGSTLKVNKGEHLSLLAKIKGGRSDFVRYPDTYADSIILVNLISKNFTKLIYSVNGKTCEWELIDEKIKFETDNQIKLELTTDKTDKHEVEVFVPVKKVEKSYIKINISSLWRFTDEEGSREETDEASFVLHLDILGSENVWFATPNVRANGKRHDEIEEKLNSIQESYNKIQELLSAFDFSPLQAEITNLRQSIQALQTKLEEIRINDPLFKCDIFFIGLPSDKAVANVNAFRSMGSSWEELNQLVEQKSEQLIQLDENTEKLKKRDLLDIIQPFIAWQKKLPVNSESLFNTYFKGMNWSETTIHSYLSFNPEEERINNLEKCKTDLFHFFDDRKRDISKEQYMFNYTLTRMQAVRIFDGMLMGFFSTINFATWENTRTSS